MTVGLAFALVAAQGRHAKRTIVRLPEAQSPAGVHGTGEPWRLVVVGDSVAAGVGLPHHGVSLAGMLAERFASDREVRRTVIAETGLTAGGVRELVRDREELARADAVVVSVGVNDTKALHSARRWERELDELLGAVTAAAPRAIVVLLGVPAMDRFVRLPWVLRQVLGLRSRRLDTIGAQVVSRHPRVRRMSMDFGGPDEGPELFASDGFHPSEALHAEFAARLHTMIVKDARP
ncbi:MAG: SGNH/GDSL hydrolase family protein [Nocardioides sp.]|nr:SGNH/GDSL hydrolase family protein [Nocardioides sp.]